MDTWIAEIKAALAIVHGNDPVRVLLILCLVGVTLISWYALRTLYVIWQAEKTEVARLQQMNAEKLAVLEQELLEIRIRRERLE